MLDVMTEGMARRGPGRPRALVGVAPADTREAILDAAAHLFATQGYAATGTREIAENVGLRQASLFHHFAHKDDLLAELLDRTVSPALAAADWLENTDAGPEVRLYLLARHDTANLCGPSQPLAALQLLPEARGPRFAPFWSKRSVLRGRYGALIDELIAAHLLAELTAEMATDLVFGAVEATIMWYGPNSPVSADEVAEAVASSAVRGVLARPPRRQDLRRAGDRLLRDVSPRRRRGLSARG